MSKVSIAVVPQFIIALDKRRVVNEMIKWIRENVDEQDWSLTACSFVSGSKVPADFRARVQYSALTFRDTAYACIFRLRYPDVLTFEDYGSGVKHTQVVKRGYSRHSSANIDIWFD